MSRDQILRERLVPPVLRCALVGLAATLALSGCGAGPVTQTSLQVSGANGASAEIGSIALRDVVLAYPGGEEVHGYEPGEEVPLLVTFVNTGDRADELVSVTTPAAGKVVVEGTTTIPGGVTVTSLGDAGTTSAHPAGPPKRPLEFGELRIVLTELTGPIRPGLPTHVTFEFRDAGKVTLRVPIDSPAETPEEPEH